MKTHNFGLCLLLLSACGTKPDLDPTLSNQQPIADAGSNGSGSTSAMVKLDGRNSYDPEGENLTYHWKFHHLPANSIYQDADLDAFSQNDSPISTSSFLPDVEGTFIVELTVKDEQGIESNVDSVVYEIKGGLLPIADAGEDQYTDLGESVTLSGDSSFDPLSRELSYFWTLVETPTTSSITELSNPDQKTTEFTPDVPGQYVLSLTVDNNVNSSQPDLLLINVLSGLPESPVADAGEDLLGEYCTAVTLDALNSSDANNDELSYHWSVLTKPEGSNAGTSSFSSLTDPKATFVGDILGEYSLVLYVNDGELWSEPDFVNVNLLDRTSNIPPEISSGSSMFIIDAGTAECSEPLPGECSHTCDECPSTSVTLGELLTINDIDGDVINYNWRVTSGSCSDSEYESRDLCENAGKNWNANAEIENPNDPTPLVVLAVGAPAAPDHCQVEKFTFEIEAKDCPGETDTKTLTYEVSCCGNNTQGPVSNGNSCCYDLDMTDSYGDGWNGANLTVNLNGSMYETFGFTTGYSASGEICLTDGSLMEMSWSSGNFDSEVGFTLTDSTGNVVFQQGSYPQTGLIYCETASCP